MPRDIPIECHGMVAKTPYPYLYPYHTHSVYYKCTCHMFFFNIGSMAGSTLAAINNMCRNAWRSSTPGQQGDALQVDG